jgi:hypothetical protein
MRIERGRRRPTAHPLSEKQHDAVEWCLVFIVFRLALITITIVAAENIIVSALAPARASPPPIVRCEKVFPRHLKTYWFLNSAII